MSEKKSALFVDLDEYFVKLRTNVTHAELALMQLSVVAKKLEKRQTLADELRLNLEVQERALKDMLVLSLARLLDKKGTRQDQLSIPNLLESKLIITTQCQKDKINRLISQSTVQRIKDTRDGMVAHSLSHASGTVLQATDVMPIIDACYDIICDVFRHNRPSGFLDRQDVSAFSKKWSEMTESWC